MSGRDISQHLAADTVRDYAPTIIKEVIIEGIK